MHVEDYNDIVILGLPIGGGFEYLFLIFTPNYLGIFDPI